LAAHWLADRDHSFRHFIAFATIYPERRIVPAHALSRQLVAAYSLQLLAYHGGRNWRHFWLSVALAYGCAGARGRPNSPG
jgi:hypothetical protein